MQSVVFPNKILPYLLVAPQIILTVVFFLLARKPGALPVDHARGRLRAEQQFRRAGQFSAVLSDESYLNSLQVTVIFSVLTALVSMGLALLLATAADRVVRGKGFTAP